MRKLKTALAIILAFAFIAGAFFVGCTAGAYFFDVPRSDIGPVAVGVLSAIGAFYLTTTAGLIWIIKEARNAHRS